MTLLLLVSLHYQYLRRYLLYANVIIITHYRRRQIGIVVAAFAVSNSKFSPYLTIF
jgi:hypothetical protein